MNRSLLTLAFASFVLALVLVACDGGGRSPSAIATQPATPVDTGVSVVDAGGPLSTVDIVRKLRPSVVQVLTESASRNVFGQLVPAQGLGTGVIIDDEGHIVTNNHVVRAGGEPLGELATRITVTLSDGRTAHARVVGTDPETDLALLEINLTGLTAAELGDAGSLAVGADVVAMGYALGLQGEPTVTRGVVSGKDRTIDEGAFSISGAIQTDASINPGNSGGPLVDDRGRVVGINTAIRVGAENVGLAISIDLVKPIVAELLASGSVSRSYLGVGTTDVTPSLAVNLGLPVDAGVGVVNVQPGTPADEAGLQPDDIIVAIGDESITNRGDLLEALRRYRPGETVTLRFVRDGDERSVEVTLAKRPS
jgi:S1-C subfamily serine protease